MICHRLHIRFLPFFLLIASLVLTLSTPVHAQRVNSTRPQRTAEGEEGYIINFNNVSIIEYIRFISKISGKNFIFDEADLDFNVTIISDEPTSLDNIMAALIHSLRIRGLTLIEQGNNLLIHRNLEIRTPPSVWPGETSPVPGDTGGEIVTQLYHLVNTNPITVAEVIRSMISPQASLQVIPETRYLVLTDTKDNVNRISNLIQQIDSPDPNLSIGHYRVQRTALQPLVALAERILTPIAGDDTLLLIPHGPSSSIFIVAPPKLIDRAQEVLGLLDGTSQLQSGRNTSVIGGRLSAIQQAEERGPRDEGEAPTIRPGVAAPRSTPGAPPPVISTSVRGDLPPQGIEAPPEGGVLSGQAPTTIPESLAKPEAGEAPGTLEAPPSFAGRVSGTLEGQPLTADQLPTEIPFTEEIPFGADPLLPALQPLPGLEDDERWLEDLPAESFERASFGMVKLNNRRGDQLQDALRDLADRLVEFGQFNPEITATVNTVQWIENSNTIVFSGPDKAVDRVKSLIKALDTPVRQVFIEMLILETTVDNSLQFGVELAGRDSSSDFGLGTGFQQTGSTLPTTLNEIGVGSNNLNPNTLASSAGFNLGIIGRAITHNGVSFTSLGALITAVSDDTDTEVVMNPKIIAEDSVSAEIFVGTNTRFRGQSITNDEGSVITTNFEFRDIGIRLKVTPFLGSGDVVTLEIEQEVSAEAEDADTTAATIATEAGPVTRKSTTETRVHVPDRYFLIISGMIQEEKRKTRNRVPCLGGLPMVGGAFGSENKTSTKRNLMIFIRPQIIDTPEEMEELTHHAQRQWRDHNQARDLFRYEVDSGLDFLKLPNPMKKH